MIVYYLLEYVLILWYYVFFVCLGFYGWNDLIIYMYINLKYKICILLICFIVVDIFFLENYIMIFVII